MAAFQNQMQRISDITQKWFLSEPLLFASWMTHKVVHNPQIETIRTGGGRIEFNSEFLATLDNRTLQDVMKFEALRIVLKHPYERRKPSAEFAWGASNIAITECIQTSLPMPSAQEKFGNRKHDRRHFEYYYNLLCGLPLSPKAAEDQLSSVEAEDCEPGDSDCESEDACEAGEQLCDEAGECEAEHSEECNGAGTLPCQQCGQSECDGCCTGDRLGAASQTAISKVGDPSNAVATSQQPLKQPRSVQEFCNTELVGAQNAIEWDYDQLFCEQLNDVITDIESSNTWGSIAGNSRELILASRRPKLDYRRVLTAFRATVLSTSRRLTRMKPSRRYGFEYMGSRRDFTTNILFAVDVSGSVSTKDVQNAFSIVNRLFKYGIESIDVIWFDTKVRNKKPLTLRRARAELRIDGRGGTCFQPLMDYLDEHRDYDGLIIFTDGIAQIPEPPQRNRRTRTVWLFNSEENWESMHEELELPGMKSAFVMPG